MQPVRSGFSDVDHSADPAALVEFLDARTGSSFFVENRRLRLAELAIRPGDRVLEVGCGTGDFTLELRAPAESDGSVVGIDASTVMIATAEKRAAGSELKPEYRVGDACNLGYPDATFDACTTERVLFHLDDPRRAIHEMARVARSGARIAVFEPDWGTMALNAPDRALTEKILSLNSGRFASPWAAREAPGMFRQAGLADVTVAARTHITMQPSRGRPSGISTT
jgi:ubiquinone/menaquinone biosynthesis C-methylase UbiE